MLAVEAQQEADMYWASHNLAREDAGEDEQGRIGTRVRIIGKGSLSAGGIETDSSAQLRMRRSSFFDIHQEG